MSEVSSINQDSDIGVILLNTNHVINMALSCWDLLVENNKKHMHPQLSEKATDVVAIQSTISYVARVFTLSYMTTLAWAPEELNRY